MSVNGTPDAVNWVITFQQEGFDTTPGAPVVKGVTIGFLVNGKVQGSVFVPAADYNPDTVRARISAAAANAWAIQSLGSTA